MATLDPKLLEASSPDCPERIAGAGFDRLWLVGELEVLHRPLLGVLCSIKCPGDVILQTYDVIRAIRDGGIPVIGGFHSPMEKECLSLLLRGSQPIVVCPARSLERMRLPAHWQKPLAERRLTILSPFAKNHHRITTQLSEQCNRFVATVATHVFVPYAAPDGKTAALCRYLTSSRKPLLTLDLPENARLLELGAKAMSVEILARQYAYIT